MWSTELEADEPDEAGKHPGGPTPGVSAAPA